MVREAQKMMQDPNFQKQMQQMMQQQGFQQAMAKTKESMADPDKLKEMEEKAQKAIEDGNKALEEYEAARRKRIEEQVRIAKLKQKEDEEAAAKAAADAAANGEDVTAKKEVDDVEMPVLNLN